MLASMFRAISGLWCRIAEAGASFLTSGRHPAIAPALTHIAVKFTPDGGEAILKGQWADGPARQAWKELPLIKKDSVPEKYLVWF